MVSPWPFAIMKHVGAMHVWRHVWVLMASGPFIRPSLRSSMLLLLLPLRRLSMPNIFWTHMPKLMYRVGWGPLWLTTRWLMPLCCASSGRSWQLHAKQDWHKRVEAMRCGWLFCGKSHPHLIASTRLCSGGFLFEEIDCQRPGVGSCLLVAHAMHRVEE